MSMRKGFSLHRTLFSRSLDITAFGSIFCLRIQPTNFSKHSVSFTVLIPRSEICSASSKRPFSTYNLAIRKYHEKEVGQRRVPSVYASSAPASSPVARRTSPSFKSINATTAPRGSRKLAPRRSQAAKRSRITIVVMFSQR